jgi:hypothetical protein
MPAIDWTYIYRQYKGLWVGLQHDQKTVVAAGRTVRGVMEEARKKGCDHPILFKVPTEIIPYVGSGWL